MLIGNNDGTYVAGPADIACIFRLPGGRYHIAVLEEYPMPGPPKSVDELDFIRLKSKMHHTAGAETLEGAQEHLAQLRKKIEFKDTNVVGDISIDMDDPVCVIQVRNWIRETMSLKEAMGIRPADTGYFEAARTHEAIFRNVLRDMKTNKQKRPMGIFIPEDLDTESSLEAIFEKYSKGERYGTFTISDFAIEGDVASIQFQDIATLSGGGAGLVYNVFGDTVTYQKLSFVMMS
ncbi:MAG: hypothetical protein Q7S95_02890 [bacterium]|nr:hypothetical protein [bacterium]